MERPSGTSRHHAVSKHKPRATEVTRGQDLLGCPSWARTRTLLIQSQACCQLHQGAEAIFVWTSKLAATTRSINPDAFRRPGPAQTFRRDSDDLPTAATAASSSRFSRVP